MKDYRRSLDDVSQERTDEFPSGVSDFSRRDFLKASGFAVGAAAVASCSRAPIEKSIPFNRAPESITPGRAYWLASTCGGCPAACGVLVKCRDGRPIKLEGNPDHPVSRGGLCAVGQASVLELYDSLRLRQPMLGGRAATWQAVDEFVASKLANARSVRVVSGTLASPSLKAQVDRFLARFQDGKHIVYDALSCSAIAGAHLKTHGVRAIPRYRFDRADTIVSLDADFLGTWISPVEFTKQYASRRVPGAMNYHVQIEPRMSLTGSNADQRLRVRPDEIGLVLDHLLNGGGDFKTVVLDKLAKRLQPGKTLVVCGSNDIDDQILTNLLNEKLGSYGTTIDLEHPSYQREGDDAEIAAFDPGSVDALFILGCNPLYDLARFEVGRVPLVVSFASHVDETAAAAHVVAPDHHFLESWRDNQPVAGVVSMTQPAIAPLGETRAAIESLAIWSGAPAKARDLVKAQWPSLDFGQTLSEGFGGAPAPPPAKSAAVGGGAPRPKKPKSGLTLVLYPTVQLLDGRHAENPWLQELPDPVSKITWDNYASFSPAIAAKLGLKDGDVVKVNGVELPAFAQPGQHDDVVAIAIGYGRKGTDRFANVGPQWLLRRVQLAPGELVGKRVNHLSGDVTIEKTGKVHALATTQLHSRLEGRDIVREVSEKESAAEGGGAPHGGAPQGGAPLWPGHEGAGLHQWAMAIDLSRCTGCASCVISCQAENNVPVVGKDEVLREREMHWIRIDRYYAGDDDVDVVHHPMLCHHCGNAPCESVCPVLATVHSSEGLNQQVYNRCVGTRYCANNCPYKTRRFNWFDYPHDDKLQNLVLNPDVTVRSRGVMEKCSMCYQRIENAKLEAKRLGLTVKDGDIQTACQQSCPADAIVFGDLKDPKSRIAALRRDPRHYLLFEELNVKPAVGYLKVVRNV